MSDEQQKPKFCDGCAMETNDLAPVIISGIGTSYQCSKCKPIIESYELSYQKKQRRKEVIAMLMRSGRTREEAQTIFGTNNE